MQFPVVPAMMAFAAVFVAPSSYAASIDFVPVGLGGEFGVPDGTTETFDGLDVVISATGGTAYFSGYHADYPQVTWLTSGLGVCDVVAQNGECERGPDSFDHIFGDKVLTLSFGSTVDVMGIGFRGGSHLPIREEETLTFAVNGGPLTELTFEEVSAGTYLNVDTLSFGYASDSIGYYVTGMEATPIPVPASVLTLGGGLGLIAWVGLSAARRRT